MNEKNLSWRYSFTGAIVTVIPLLIIMQIVRIQVDPQQLEKILEQNSQYVTKDLQIIPVRGQIYDTHGILLAGNQKVYELGVELEKVSNPRAIADLVSKVLGIPYEQVLARASLEPSDEAVYSVIDSFVSQGDMLKVEATMEIMDDLNVSSDSQVGMVLDGLVSKSHLARFYPNKSLGASFLGFVSREGKGYFGVEERFDEILAGKPRWVKVPIDPNRVHELPKVPDGASLILTIDRDIQLAMEEIIDAAVVESGSEAGSLLVMNPRTGEVLAMATQPRMDLNEFWKYQEYYDRDNPFNRVIMKAYEPGSVFKVLTMLAALASGRVTLDTSFLDTGAIEVGGHTITNWDLGAWGPQSMQGCMQHSLNVCLAWVATQMGPEILYKYLKDYGIGNLTGIDLAGENPGHLKVPGDSDWYEADLGTNAFGQGVSATVIQMATAISAVPNKGVMMAPRIVRAVVSEGYQHNIEPRVAGIPVIAESANTLNEMLARSLEIESSLALVTGYRVAGKTGTAEIPTKGGYTSSETNASFVGWGPVDDPQVIVYVWLEKPTSAPWGSVVAAPVFKQAMERLVILLDIPPDDIRKKLQPQASSN